MSEPYLPTLDDSDVLDDRARALLAVVACAEGEMTPEELALFDALAAGEGEEEWQPLPGEGPEQYKRVAKDSPGAIEKKDKRGRSYYVDKETEKKAPSQRGKKADVAPSAQASAEEVPAQKGAAKGKEASSPEKPPAVEQPEAPPEKKPSPKEKAPAKGKVEERPTADSLWDELSSLSNEDMEKALVRETKDGRIVQTSRASKLIERIAQMSVREANALRQRLAEEKVWGKGVKGGRTVRARAEKIVAYLGGEQRRTNAALLAEAGTHLQEGKKGAAAKALRRLPAGLREKALAAMLPGEKAEAPAVEAPAVEAPALSPVAPPKAPPVPKKAPAVPAKAPEVTPSSSAQAPSAQIKDAPSLAVDAMRSLEPQARGGMISISDIRRKMGSLAGRELSRAEVDAALQKLRRDKVVRFIAAGAGKGYGGEEERHWDEGIAGEGEHFKSVEWGPNKPAAKSPPVATVASAEGAAPAKAPPAPEAPPPAKALPAPAKATPKAPASSVANATILDGNGAAARSNRAVLKQVAGGGRIDARQAGVLKDALAPAGLAEKGPDGKWRLTAAGQAAHEKTQVGGKPGEKAPATVATPEKAKAPPPKPSEKAQPKPSPAKKAAEAPAKSPVTPELRQSATDTVRQLGADSGGLVSLASLKKSLPFAGMGDADFAKAIQSLRKDGTLTGSSVEKGDKPEVLAAALPDENGAKLGYVALREGEAAPPKATAKAPTTVDRDEVVRRMYDAEPSLARSDSQPPVSVKDLTKGLSGAQRKQLDATLMDMAEKGEIHLHVHDHPGSLTQAQRDAMLRDPETGDYFTGISFAGQAPPRPGKAPAPASKPAPGESRLDRQQALAPDPAPAPKSPPAATVASPSAQPATAPQAPAAAKAPTPPAMLEGAEATDLFDKARAGDKQARNRFVEANEGLANKIGNGDPDLKQAAWIALNDAIDRYDPDNPKRVTFPKYAAFVMRRAAAREANQRLVQTPEVNRKLVAQWLKAQSALRDRNNGREPSDEQVRDSLDWDKKKAKIALKTLKAQQVAQEAPSDSDDAAGGALAEAAVDAGESAHEQLVDDETRERLNEAIDHLSSEDADLVRQHYGLGTDREEHTLRDIGEQRGMSKQAISPKLKRALVKLREKMGGQFARLHRALQYHRLAALARQYGDAHSAIIYARQSTEQAQGLDLPSPSRARPGLAIQYQRLSANAARHGDPHSARLYARAAQEALV